MRLADREVGPEHRLFIAAELGVTACGSVERAKALVDAVADAGADAAKFIVTDPEIVADKAHEFSYLTYELQDINEDGSERRYVERENRRPLYDLLKEMTFSVSEWAEIKRYCDAKGVIFFATADHLDAVDLLESLDVPAHKLSAWDIAYMPLIEKMRATGKPVLVDVGTVNRAELLAALPDEKNLLFVHDPHPPDWNLSRLVGFFRPDYPVGFSSPDRGMWCDLVALGGGACYLEKRLTLKRDDPTGHHHAISLEPAEFKVWVKEMRRVDALRKADPFGGTERAWADRKKYTRGPDGRIP